MTATKKIPSVAQIVTVYRTEQLKTIIHKHYLSFAVVKTTLLL